MGRLTRRSVPRLALGLAVAGCALLAPGTARAESALWTMTATPLVATTGVETTYTLTATNQDTTAALLSANEIGCLRVTVPANFAVAASAVTGSNAGGSWASSLAGNIVRVSAGSGGDRLQYLEWVRFTVRATATSVGSLAWSARAYRQQDCSGSGTALGVPPVVVVSGPAVTPTPVPTPVSTPVATPTPSPTPILPLPTVLPSLGLPSPSLGASPSAEPTASPRPGSSEAPAATPSPPDGVVGGGFGGGTESPGAAPVAPSPGVLVPRTGGTVVGAPESVARPRIAFEEARLDVSFDVGGLLDGVETWAVPAATLGFPGLLLLLWVAVQTAGALAWIPAVRRFRGEDRETS